MSDRDVLERIATALERLASPVDEPVNWLTDPAYLCIDQAMQPISQIDTVDLDQLHGIDAQKSAVLQNLERFVSGTASHDMLLWGARGTGKSALVRACTHAVQGDDSGHLALVQMSNEKLPEMPKLIGELADIDRKFLLFIDDLSFDAGSTQSTLALRSVLDGGVMMRPENVRLAVTSNRRALVARTQKENEPLHERDERDNSLALADRFGLTLAFHPCDQQTYLKIIGAYLQPLGLKFDPAEAHAWAIARGNRSGRTAYQFAVEMAGQAGLAL